MSLHQTPSRTGRKKQDIVLVGGAAAWPWPCHRGVGPEDASNPTSLRQGYLPRGRAER